MARRNRKGQGVTEGWVSQFRTQHPTYERFCAKLETLLTDLLRTEGVAYQVVESRAKDIASFEEKIQRDGRQYTDPLNEITDLAGLRVILNYVSDVERVNEVIRREFRVDDRRSIDKRQALATDQFGYLSVHWIVQLSAVRASLPEWSGFAPLFAEIQVRTVVQHSWAAISHALQYKREGEVPSSFRRRLVRLAGLLELADEEFDALRREQASLRERAAERITEGKLNIPITAFSAIEYVASSSAVEAVAASAVSAGMSMADGDTATPEGDDRGISQLVSACKVAKIRTVEELDAFLLSDRATSTRVMTRFVAAFMKLLPRSQRDNFTPNDVIGSPAHFAAVFVTAKARRLGGAKMLAEKIGWGEAYAQAVIEAHAEFESL